MRKHRRIDRGNWLPGLICVLTAGWMTGLTACSDSGSDPVAGPRIDLVRPDSGAAGDTVIVEGARFGAVRSSGTVTFGGIPAVRYPSWTDGRIEVVIPAAAVTGSVVVSVGNTASNSVPFRVTTPGGASGISFAGQVQPILTTGCALSGCHRPPSPSSGFDQSAYAALRLGGTKFGAAVIIPGDSANSMIVRAMRGTAPGLGRMPFGGPWAAAGVPDSLITTIGRWIQEGALDN